MGLFSDRKARAIKPADKPLQGGVTGLWLLPGSKPGHGRWILRFVSPATAKRRDMGLGSYPDVPIALARERAQAARQQIAKGHDPIEQKQAEKAIPTFEQAARKHWLTISKPFRSDKHRQQWIGSLERHIFPAIGNRKVSSLGAKDFANVINRILLTTPVTAKRIVARCDLIMAACKASGFAGTNPVIDASALLSKPADSPDIHMPAMPWKALPGFVHDHLAELCGAKAALMFVILTAARSGEVRGMTWAEIDFEGSLWTIPGSRMKARKIHRVPLSRQALEILHTQHRLRQNDFVFPGMRGKAGKLSENTMSLILKRLQVPSDTPSRLATVHGFRASFRNWCADNGVMTELAERCLAHTIGNKVQASYERTDRLDARVELMQDWADFVTTNKLFR